MTDSRRTIIRISSAPARTGSTITDRFGTSRGLVRLLLAHAQTRLGVAKIKPPSPQAVRRLVFVCQGNICRSAFADVVARQIGLVSCSFGLSTVSGQEAHPPAVKTADRLGFDLRAHRTTACHDYALQPGDFLLAMEVRQLYRIAADPRLTALPRSLLGLWAAPRRPHLHDPYLLSEAYMKICFTAIESAVLALAGTYPDARQSESVLLKKD